VVATGKEGGEGRWIDPAVNSLGGRSFPGGGGGGGSVAAPHGDGVMRLPL
jgi:hypothetical protein